MNSPGSTAIGIALWSAACCSVLFLLLWPVFGGMASVNDDMTYSRLIHLRENYAENLAAFWRHRFFRPIDILGGYLVNPATLDARPALLLHLPALAAILAAIWAALRRLGGGRASLRLAFPIAVVYLAVHTATSNALWQHDTISQTWSAACGLWLGIVLWQAVENALGGRPILREAILLVLLGSLGSLAKEVFLGWIAAAAVMLALSALAAARQRNSRALPALAVLLLAVAVVPVGYLFLRHTFGGLGELALAEAGRYRPQLGWNVIGNLVLGAAGYFSAVPVHVLRNPHAPPLLRIVPLLGICLGGLVCIAPWALSWRRPESWPDRPPGKPVTAVALFTFLGLLATLPTRRIAEVYLMGPNAGAAVLVAIGAVGLWQLRLPKTTWGLSRFSRSENGTVPLSPLPSLPRAVIAIAILLVFSIGAYGLLSRAVHARLTWCSVARLNGALLERQESLPPDADRVMDIFVCDHRTERFRHCQYILPAVLAINAQTTQAWMNHRDPLRRVRVLGLVGKSPAQRPTPAPRTARLVMECAGLPRHPHW